MPERKEAILEGTMTENIPPDQCQTTKHRSRKFRRDQAR
jgi:hypothetical protein